MRRSLITVAVLAFAAVLRCWGLSFPDSLVFDELYYVRDAYSQLVHGFATEWPDNEKSFNAAVAATMLSDAAYVAHPPLGKWMISTGMLVFGIDSGWGWRAATALVGTLTVALTMLLAWRMTRVFWVAQIAGLLLAVEGLHVTLSRVSLLDGHLALLVVVGALLLWRDREWARERWGRFASARLRASRMPSRPPVFGRVFLWRPWLFAAAFVFGLAAGVKWSGLAIFAVFLIGVLVQDVVARVRLNAGFAGIGTLLQTAILLIPVLISVVAAYLATWAGWLATSGGWARDAGPWPNALWRTHTGLFDWHLGLSDPHPFASHPLGWPLSIRPTGMFFAELDDGWVSAISPLPNVLVTWGGVVALVFLIATLTRLLIVRRRALVAHPVVLAAAFAMTGYLAGWLPWVLTVSRSAVFQFYLVVASPFLAIALALTLAVVSGRVRLPGATFSPDTARDRETAVRIFIIAAVVIGLFFWPMWSGAPQPMWLRDMHLWLPGWR